MQKYKPLESVQPRNEPGTPNVQRFTLKTFKKCSLEPKVSNFFLRANLPLLAALKPLDKN